jgi:hypothetical protein
VAERNFLGDIESLKHEIYTFEALELIDRYLELQASKSTMNYLKKLWTALNTDITPLAQAFLKSYSDCHNPYSVVH